MNHALQTTTRICMAAALLWSCGGKDNPDPVTPKAPTAITLSVADIQAERAGGDFPVIVTAPERPTVSAKPDWVTVQDGTFNKDTYKVTLTLKLAAYGAYGNRSGEVTFKSGSLTKTLKISQKGRVQPAKPEIDIDEDLVTAGATTEAQALYGYLLANYGKKILSGIMADVAWNHTEADKVGKAVGKYPALNCYDFIHIQVPDGNGWINYSDITPVTEWANAGGIVALMWHFNVPLSETTTIGKDGSGCTCSPDKTTFKGSNALKEGTWENKYFYDQLDRVANVILQLQEAGIPAIWRPFHEAAGNYYALGYKGSAWFWWGAEGPSVFKQLWNALFDYFAGKGIKNLIWVWTAQDYNGDPSAYDSDEAYYPGDDRVDIVGRDLYGQDADANLGEFLSAQTAYPNKMIALSENGKNGSIEYGLMSEVWQAGAQWSWFMPWYGASMPSTAWWQDALNCEHVITREQVNL